MTIVGALMGLLLFGSAVGALPAEATAPALPPLPTYAVTLTAYNAVPEQTDGDPHITASGAYSNPEIIAARSRNLAKELPFGTIIEIIGPEDNGNTCGYHVVEPIVGYRIIADTMNARYTDRIDILFSTNANYLTGGRTKNAGHILGICKDASIRVVGHVDITHPGNLPDTQEELVAIVKGGDLALALK